MKDEDMQSSQSKSDRVRSFWEYVWDQGKIELIDTFMTEDFVIHSGGIEISPRSAFRVWVQAFQSKIDDLVFQVEDVFESDNKVTSRWRITGRNRGFMGTADNGKLIDLTGITISIVRDDGLIAEKWVERSAWELWPKIQ